MLTKDILHQDNRARKDFGDLSDLANSISRVGIIHPIVIDDTNSLIAGERRLLAMILLGFTELEENKHFRRLSSLSTIEKKEIELLENIKRKEMTWEEQVSLTEEIHNLKVEIAAGQGNDWTKQQTAEELGVSIQQFNLDLRLSEVTKSDPSLVSGIKDKKTAISRLRHRESQEKRAIENLAFNRVQSTDSRIIHGDCLSELKKLPDLSVDLTIIDPPFGVDFDQCDHAINYPSVYGDFKDTKENALELLRGCLEEVKRVAKIGSHIYIFFGISYISDIEDIIISTIGAYQKQPMFWIKPSIKNWRPMERAAVNYEGFFHCWNFSKRKDFLKTTNAALPFPVPQNKQHPAEKSEELYKHLIEISSIPGETVLDPFTGSGRSIATAVKLDRKGVGIELHEPYFQLATKNLREAYEQRKG